MLKTEKIHPEDYEGEEFKRAKVQKGVSTIRAMCVIAFVFAALGTLATAWGIFTLIKDVIELNAAHESGSSYLGVVIIGPIIIFAGGFFSLAFLLEGIIGLKGFRAASRGEDTPASKGLGIAVIISLCALFMLVLLLSLVSALSFIRYFILCCIAGVFFPSIWAIVYSLCARKHTAFVTDGDRPQR